MQEEIEEWLKNPDLQIIDRFVELHTMCGIQGGWDMIKNRHTDERYKLKWWIDFDRNNKLTKSYVEFPVKLEYNFVI